MRPAGSSEFTFSVSSLSSSSSRPPSRNVRRVASRPSLDQQQQQSLVDPTGAPTSSAVNSSPSAWLSSIYREPVDAPVEFVEPASLHRKGKGRAREEEQPDPVEDKPQSSSTGNICGPCRKYKRRCDRGRPCAVCIGRGHPEECMSDNELSRYTLRLGNDAAALESQLHRLQALVGRLTSQRKPEAPPSEPTPRPEADTPAQSSATANTRQSRFSTTDTASQFDPVEQTEEVDLQASDLVEALSRLAIHGVINSDATFGKESYAPKGTVSGTTFVREADEFLASFPTRMGLVASPDVRPGVGNPDLPELPTPTSLLLPAGPDDVKELLALLPPAADINRFVGVFMGGLNWFTQALHAPTFYEDYAAFTLARDGLTTTPLDLTFVGLLFVMCSSVNEMGLMNGRIPSEWNEEKKAARFHLAASLLKGAMLALRASRFTLKPTLNGINTIILIATSGIFQSTGDNSATCIGLVTLAVQSAFSMGMHRDPQRKGGPGLPIREAELRRRAFWGLFYTSSKTNWVYSLPDGSFDLSHIDCSLPLDCDDDELLLEEDDLRARVEARVLNPRPTSMTAILLKYRIALLMKKSSEQAFNIAVPYATTLQLHEQLVAFEGSLPPFYRVMTDDEGGLIPWETFDADARNAGVIAVTLAAAYVRVHRPWLILAATDPRYSLSRTTSVRYARLLLQIIVASPYKNADWGAHNYKIISCGIIILFELLQSSQPNPQLEALVRQAIEIVASCDKTSTICRKGTAILKFLLGKLEEAQEKQPETKRLRREMDGAGSTWTPLHNVFDPVPSNG